MNNILKVSDSAVSVEIDFSSCNNQELTVNLSFFAPKEELQFSIPNWTPGSYTVRDYSQYIYNLELTQFDSSLSLDRVSTNTWKARVKENQLVNISYKAEAKEMTVRTSYIDSDFASICLPAVIMKIQGLRINRYSLTLKLPSEWKSYATLDKELNYFANNYDVLVDSPLIAGKFDLLSFQVLNNTHDLIIIGELPKVMKQKILRDLSKVCEACCSLFNSSPPAQNKYAFILQIADSGYGGLEHDNSCVCLYPLGELYTDSGYRRLMQLLGHEYYHQWNVRRLRPKEYINYDYDNPVISSQIWFSEGITSYYDLALPYLSGIATQKQFLSDFSSELTKAVTTPGRNIHSLADCSKETWVKLYKRKPYSSNTQISYYLEGSVLSFCLDVKLLSSGSSLTKFMRIMWNKYGYNCLGFTEDDVLNTLASIDSTVSKELSKWITVPNSLPVESSLYLLGLTLTPTDKPSLKTGLSFTNKDQNLIISNVQTNSAASIAGLAINDEIVAINGFRVKDSYEFNKHALSNTSLNITYFRRGYQKKTIVIFDEFEKLQFSIESLDQKTASQQKLFASWLAFQ